MSNASLPVLPRPLQDLLGSVPLKALAAPLLVVLILTMMVLPLPPFLLQIRHLAEPWLDELDRLLATSPRTLH